MHFNNDRTHANKFKTLRTGGRRRAGPRERARGMPAGAGAVEVAAAGVGAVEVAAGAGTGEGDWLLATGAGEGDWLLVTGAGEGDWLLATGTGELLLAADAGAGVEKGAEKGVRRSACNSSTAFAFPNSTASFNSSILLRRKNAELNAVTLATS